VRQIP